MSAIKTLSVFLCICAFLISESMSTVTNVKYEEFKQFTKDPTALVIDVREPNEIREGAIPGAINIPLNKVQNVLNNLNKDEFRKQYRREKPEVSSKVVFTCRSGRRSAQAAQIANKLGYKNVFNFTGGWLEWEEKTRG